MDRQTLSPEAENFVAQQRAYHREQADLGGDDDLDPQHRRNREHVLGPLCRVKEDDDVLANGVVIRVICPAREEGWFYGLQESPWGLIDAPFDGRFITDRAPADSNDEPLPIWPDVEPEPPIEWPPPPPPLDAEALNALRLDVIKQVDVTSTALIRAGFEFEGVIFSMSNEAQIRYLAMQSDADYLPYPLPINSKDDSTFIMLRDAAHTIAFCRGAKAHVMGVVGSGHLQKRIVHSLQTAAELSTYLDPRAEAVHPELLAQTASDMAAGKTALGL